jgi:hypothetical protein
MEISCARIDPKPIQLPVLLSLPDPLTIRIELSRIPET